MRIGIIGAGHAGKALGKGFVEAGHQVTLGSRKPQDDKYDEWKQAAGGNGRLASYAEAARSAELIVAALPWSCMKEVLETIEPTDLRNKTVIDVSNAVRFDAATGLQLLYSDTSAGELVQQWLPDSLVVKSLNTVSDGRMVRPSFKEGRPVMFVSGNERQAKASVQSLLRDIGWERIVDLGDIRQSRLQEAMMVTCVRSEMALRSAGAAFALLTE